MRGGPGAAPADRRHRRRQRREHRAAREARLPPCRHDRAGRLQVRPLARSGVLPAACWRRHDTRSTAEEVRSMYELVIANKNYSSWSMRPVGADARARDRLHRAPAAVHARTTGRAISGRFSPSGRVPCLVDGSQRRLGFAGDRRVPGGAASGRVAVAGRVRAPGRAAQRRRCTPASPRCATSAR